jgi:hypothetical protein
MTATPAGCVRPSQAGKKLERTQTSVALLRIVINIDSKEQLAHRQKSHSYDTHDDAIGARGFFGTAVTAGY